MSVRFRTELSPKKVGSIRHDTPAIFMGSCFSEHMGNRLIARKFNTINNPFGIIYHPLALLSGLKRLFSDEPFDIQELIKTGDRYASFWHHGRFSHRDPQVALKTMNDRFNQARDQLAINPYVFITWGSAYGYRHPTHQETAVANCHKLPAKDFKRFLSSPEDLIKTYTHFLELLVERYPKIQLFISVSPVKHLKDGLIENNRSKSTLLIAAHQLADRFEQVHYFPAYELVVDDLRDYRFYADDLAHPSTAAVEYVWNFFKASFFNETTERLTQRIEKILKAVDHRPIDTGGPSHQTFIKNTLEAIKKAEIENPHIDFSLEKVRLKN